MKKAVFFLIGFWCILCSCTYAQTDTIKHLSLESRINKIADSKIYDMTYIGTPLIISGLIIKGEDEHFQTLRDDYTPTTRYHYDDYLQYLPAAAMLGMKIGGVESRSSWGRMLTSDACSTLLMFSTVRILKSSTDVIRPDGSDHNSFPSGHTATAFMTATMMHKEYGDLNPWYSIGAYSIATATGLSREINNKHWMSDVLVGAGIGILSTETGYLLADLIFKKRGLHTFQTETYNFSTNYKPTFIGLYVGLNKIIGEYTLKDGQSIEFSTGSRLGIEGAYFINPYIGFGGLISASNMAYITDKMKVEETYQVASYLAGPYLSYPLSNRWMVGSKLLVGYNVLHIHDLSKESDNSLTTGTGLSLTFRATEKLGARIYTDYSVRSISSIQEKVAHLLTAGGNVYIMF